MKSFFYFLIGSITLLSDIRAQTIDGLVLYFPFNGNANDESSYGNNGTVYGGAMLTTDRFGNPDAAYYFDGIDDYIEVQDNASLNPSNITLCAWIKPEISSSHTPDIIRKSTYSDATNEQYLLRLNNDTDAQTFIKANTTCDFGAPWTAVNQTQAVQLNEWAFLAATFDSTDLELYVNGVLVNKTSISKAPLITCTGSNLRIGLAWNTYQNYFKGSIDDIKIYNKALSDCQIEKLYDIPSVISAIKNKILQSYEMSLFPNPLNDEIVTISGKDINKLATYEIYKPTGEKIVEGSTSGSINAPSLTPGLYILIVRDANKTILKEFKISKN